MAASKNAVSIVLDNDLGPTTNLIFPKTQHAEDFTPDYSREDQDDYTTFRGVLTYKPTEGGYAGQDVKVTFNGYYDTPGDLWTRKFIIETESGGHITVTAANGHAMLLHFTLDHTSDTMNLLGAKVTGNSSSNVINGSLIGDTLYGKGGNDTLNGRSGDDLLVGGSGKDDLTGGLGSDTFLFQRLSDSGVSSSARDTIRDFSYNDIIDLSKIDANTERSGNNTFRWIDHDYFSGRPGDLRYSKSGVLSGDVDGDKHADFSINIGNDYDLQKDHFIL